MTVTQNAVVTAQSFSVGRVQLTNSTSVVGTGLGAPSNAPQKIIAPGTNGSFVKQLSVCSDDTAARVLTFYIYDGTTYWPLGAVNIPLTSGATGTIANIDVLASTVFLGCPLDPVGRNVLPLASTDTGLYVGPQATLTAAKTITITAYCENL